MCAPPNSRGIGKSACADAQRKEKEVRMRKKEGKREMEVREREKEKKVKRGGERDAGSLVAVYRMRPVYVRSFALQT